VLFVRFHGGNDVHAIFFADAHLSLPVPDFRADFVAPNCTGLGEGSAALR
jgi:hypothetical protein